MNADWLEVLLIRDFTQGSLAKLQAKSQCNDHQHLSIKVKHMTEHVQDTG